MSFPLSNHFYRLIVPFQPTEPWSLRGGGDAMFQKAVHLTPGKILPATFGDPRFSRGNKKGLRPTIWVLEITVAPGETRILKLKPFSNVQAFPSPRSKRPSRTLGENKTTLDSSWVASSALSSRNSCVQSRRMSWS